MRGRRAIGTRATHAVSREAGDPRSTGAFRSRRSNNAPARPPVVRGFSPSRAGNEVGVGVGHVARERFCPSRPVPDVRWLADSGSRLVDRAVDASVEAHPSQTSDDGTGQRHDDEQHRGDDPSAAQQPLARGELQDTA